MTGDKPWYKDHTENLYECECGSINWHICLHDQKIMCMECNTIEDMEENKELLEALAKR